MTKPLVILFTVTSFLASSLVFLVQPMVAKSVLPLYGGSPSVWNVCMVFFQSALLLGYAYAHVTWRKLRLRQPAIHIVVMSLPLLLLPIALPAWAEPPAGQPAALWLLLVLAVAVGGPYLLVSTSAPLLQAWFSTTDHPRATDPYFLYAAGNAGSLTGLLAYPFLLEPTLAVPSQARFWAVGYVVLIAALAACALLMRARRGAENTRQAFAEAGEQPAGTPEVDTKLTWRQRLWWLALSALPSSLLLGVTTFITTDLAAVPLLWVIPLALYLLTFIVAFGQRGRSTVKYAFPLALALLLLVFAELPSGAPNIVWVASLHLTLFTVLAYLAHRRLAERRPATRQLTQFYLLVSLGGALGGALTTLVAPVIFDSAAEYFVAMAGTLILLAAVEFQSKARRLPRPALVATAAVPAVGYLAWNGVAGTGAAAPAMIVLVGTLALVFVRPALLAAVMALALIVVVPGRGDSLLTERSFFGVYRVVEAAPGVHRLDHGTTIHGVQDRNGANRFQPRTYYARTGPIGDVMGTYQQPGQLTRVAVVGLGTGSMAAYGRPGDAMDFYEIDPLMIDIATDPQYFTYLSDSAAAVRTIAGDGRLKLEDAPDGSYDLLAIDAFSSDAIPAHLLTAEAIELYRSKLAPGGILLLHITNRHLDLEPVAEGVTRAAGMNALIDVDLDADNTAGESASLWVAASSDPMRLEALRQSSGWRDLRQSDGSVWTDDYSNIVTVLR